MADTTAQRWMRLIGGQGRPPSDAVVAETVSRYLERASQILVDQSRARGEAISAQQARRWIHGQIANEVLLDQAMCDRIAELSDALIVRQFPEDRSDDG